LNAVWVARSLSHIRRLRKAVNADGDFGIVRTARSAGYALDRARD
jgi:DNA-binding response OmpR family regulator